MLGGKRVTVSHEIIKVWIVQLLKLNIMILITFEKLESYPWSSEGENHCDKI